MKDIGVKEQKNFVKAEVSLKEFTGCKDECNKNTEMFSDTVTNCLLLSIVLPQIPDFINNSLTNFRAYQERTQVMVRSATLRLCASFGLRVERQCWDIYGFIDLVTVFHKVMRWVLTGSTVKQMRYSLGNTAVATGPAAIPRNKIIS